MGHTQMGNAASQSYERITLLYVVLQWQDVCPVGYRGLLTDLPSPLDLVFNVTLGKQDRCFLLLTHSSGFEQNIHKQKRAESNHEQRDQAQSFDLRHTTRPGGS